MLEYGCNFVKIRVVIVTKSKAIVTSCLVDAWLYMIALNRARWNLVCCLIFLGNFYVIAFVGCYCRSSSPFWIVVTLVLHNSPICAYPIIHLDWRLVFGYFLKCTVSYWFEVPLYLHPPPPPPPSREHSHVKVYGDVPPKSVTFSQKNP